MKSGSPVCTKYGRPETSTAACASDSSIGMKASPKRRMPVLSPSAWPSAWPSTIAVSSMVWWPSISMSPTALTVRSKLAWVPSEVSMWSKNGTPVSTLDLPGAVEVELDDDVGFLGLAFDLRARSVAGRVTCHVLLVGRWHRAARRSRRRGRWWCADIRGCRRRGSAPRRRGSAARWRRRRRTRRTAGSSASLGITRKPRSVNAFDTRSRSAISVATLPRVSSACRRAARAAAWVSDDRWYGSRTSSIASTTAGAATR